LAALDRVMFKPAWWPASGSPPPHAASPAVRSHLPLVWSCEVATAHFVARSHRGLAHLGCRITPSLRSSGRTWRDLCDRAREMPPVRPLLQPDSNGYQHARASACVGTRLATGPLAGTAPARFPLRSVFEFDDASNKSIAGGAPVSARTTTTRRDFFGRTSGGQVVIACAARALRSSRRRSTCQRAARILRGSGGEHGGNSLGARPLN